MNRILVSCLTYFVIASASATLGDKPGLKNDSPYSKASGEQSAVEIKEYTNADGIVYAVTWQGRKQPDLESLLGTYYHDFHKKNSSRQPGVHSHRTQTRDIVVHRGGRFPHLTGRAYVPSL